MVSLLAIAIFALTASVPAFIAARWACRASERMLGDYEEQWRAQRRLEEEVRRQQRQPAASANQTISPKVTRKSKKVVPKPEPVQAVEPLPLVKPEEYFDVERTE